jgi:hypothetical protein
MNSADFDSMFRFLVGFEVVIESLKNRFPYPVYNNVFSAEKGNTKRFLVPDNGLKPKRS